MQTIYETPLIEYLIQKTNELSIEFDIMNIKKMIYKIEPKYSILLLKCYDYERNVNKEKNEYIYKYFLKKKEFNTLDTKFYEEVYEPLESYGNKKILFLNGSAYYATVSDNLCDMVLEFLEDDRIDLGYVHKYNKCIIITRKKWSTNYLLEEYGIFKYIRECGNMYDRYLIYNIFEERNILFCDSVLKKWSIKELSGKKYESIEIDIEFVDYDKELVEVITILEKIKKDVEMFNIYYRNVVHLIPNRTRIENKEIYTGNNGEVIYAIIDKMI